MSGEQETVPRGALGLVPPWILLLEAGHLFINETLKTPAGDLDAILATQYLTVLRDGLADGEPTLVTVHLDARADEDLFLLCDTMRTWTNHPTRTLVTKASAGALLVGASGTPGMRFVAPHASVYFYPFLFWKSPSLAGLPTQNTGCATALAPDLVGPGGNEKDEDDPQQNGAVVRLKAGLAEATFALNLRLFCELARELSDGKAEHLVRRFESCPRLEDIRPILLAPSEIIANGFADAILTPENCACFYARAS